MGGHVHIDDCQLYSHNGRLQKLLWRLRTNNGPKEGDKGKRRFPRLTARVRIRPASTVIPSRRPLLLPLVPFFFLANQRDFEFRRQYPSPPFPRRAKGPEAGCRILAKRQASERAKENSQSERRRVRKRESSRTGPRVKRAVMLHPARRPRLCLTYEPIGEVVVPFPSMSTNGWRPDWLDGWLLFGRFLF